MLQSVKRKMNFSSIYIIWHFKIKNTPLRYVRIKIEITHTLVGKTSICNEIQSLKKNCRISSALLQTWLYGKTLLKWEIAGKSWWVLELTSRLLWAIFLGLSVQHQREAYSPTCAHLSILLAGSLHCTSALENIQNHKHPPNNNHYLIHINCFQWRSSKGFCKALAHKKRRFSRPKDPTPCPIRKWMGKSRRLSGLFGGGPVLGVHNPPHLV